MACLLTAGNFPNTVSGVMQWALHTVQTWCDEIELPVNPDKPELVFIRKRKLPGYSEPLLGGLLYVALCRSSISR
jgi:hypothetical protein